MPKKRPHGRRPIHRRAEPRRHLHAVPDDATAPDPDLLDTVRHALRDPSPAALLQLTSMVLEVSDPRNAETWEDPAEGPVSRAEMVRSFADVRYAETTALLTVMSQLLPDGDPALAEILEELPQRRHPLPAWLRALRAGDVEVRVLRMTEDLGDGENCVLGVRFPSGEELTAIIFIDHNLGSAVKDAFFLTVTMDELSGRIRAGEFEAPGPDLIQEWDPATARATVEAALERGRQTLGMPESESWPALRPAVEWLLRLLPEGGTSTPEERWSEAEVEALKAEFLASPEGAVVDDAETADALDLILSFGSGYNVGGPLRWSPVVAEIFLLDWMPRKVFAPFDEVEMMPTLLSHFVQYAHRREGIDGEVTGEVLLVIGSMVADYGAAMRAADADAEFDPVNVAGLLLERLAATVGGHEVLDSLDDNPLPDEELDWEGIPEDIHERVGEYVALLDRVAVERLDVEYRTAMRRLLAIVAAGDPAIFRRRASVERGAAALAWVVCEANDTANAAGLRLTQKEVAGWFGTSGSLSQRAEPMRRAVDRDWRSYGFAEPLGRVDLLVSGYRAAVMEMRDSLTRGDLFPGGGDLS